MQNHPGGDGRRGILPVAFLRAIFPGAHKHVRNVLRIRNIAMREEADLGQWVETRRVLGLHRRELETEMPGLARKPAVFAQFSPLMS